MFVLSTLALIFVGVLGLLFVIEARALTTAVLRVPNRMRPFGEATLGSGSLGARFVIAFAGLLAAYVFAAGLSVGGLMVGGEGFPTGAPVVDVLPGSPAASAGLKDGDRIVAIEGTPMTDFGQLRAFIERQPGRPVPFE